MSFFGCYFVMETLIFLIALLKGKKSYLFGRKVQIMTTQRRSILCPNCRKLISSDEPSCPHCGLARPGSWWKNSLLARGFNSPKQLLRNIIYLNIGMFILSLVVGPRFQSLSLSPFALLSANYLHAGVLHVLFNVGEGGRP